MHPSCGVKLAAHAQVIAGRSLLFGSIQLLTDAFVIYHDTGAAEGPAPNPLVFDPAPDEEARPSTAELCL
jgi:hypothetical protein